VSITRAGGAPIPLTAAAPRRPHFGIGFGLPRPDVLPWAPDEKICSWGRLGRLRDPHGRRPPDDVLLHEEQDGSGIIGSGRRTGYGQAVYDAVTG
jgi:hypothetical protein